MFSGTTRIMSSTGNRATTIPPELEAEMTPAVRHFVGMLLDRITQLESGRTTPQNSSLPPSSVHPHATRLTEPKSKKNVVGSQDTRSTSGR